MAVGTTLGSYEIHRELGRGGMGAVYVGRHQLLGRSAAIKILLPQYSRDQELVQRFFNEARAATAIRHPSIVEIFDFGYAADGSAYIVMELCEGESLAMRLRRQPVMPVAAALAIARQIAGALAAAHRAGIVHRDLKPDNIFIVPDPEVANGERIKLLDFGIAKLTNESALGNAATQTGAIMGTPYYMSPEQCRGAGKVDHRADLYSLGCILFEMLCGRVPFVGNGPGDIISAHLLVAPPRPTALANWVPPDVEALVLALLAKAPEARPGSAEEVVAALQHMIGSSSQPRWDAAAMGQLPTQPPAPTVPPIAYGTAPHGSPSQLSATAPTRRGRGALIAVIVACPIIAIAVIAIYLGTRSGDEHRGADKTPTKTPGGEPAEPIGSAIDKVVVAPKRTCTIAKLDGCTEACDGGDLAACTRLGLAYEWGAGKDYSPGHALAMYIKACDGAFADGCTRLGTLYDTGKGVKHDVARARELLQRGCDGKSALGCHLLADHYWMGRKVEMDGQRELELRTRACDLDYAAGCMDAATNLQFGERVPADAARAKALYDRAITLGTKACEAGDAESCDKIGQAYFWGLGVPRDRARALVTLQRACDLGYPATCTELGYMYKTGRGMHRDEQRSKALIDKACGQGNLDACVGLGEFYEIGLAGTTIDYAKARKLYEAACEVDYAGGCTSLGTQYANARGVPKDVARGNDYFRKGCDLGDAYGCINLAEAIKKQDAKRATDLQAKACKLDSKTCHFLGGALVNTDPKTAMTLLERTCTASGGETGCNWVGYMYLQGKGVAKDIPRGIKYFEDACENEDSSSCVGLGDMFASGSSGLTKDLKRALALYERGCTLLYGFACHKAADIYASGKVGPANAERAAELKKQACTFNDATACKSTSSGTRTLQKAPTGYKKPPKPPVSGGMEDDD